MINYDLPHFVHRKTAKGKTYYYFALEQATGGNAPFYENRRVPWLERRTRN